MHTPSPWVIDKTNTTVFYIEYEDASSLWTIATIENFGGQSKADAHLIATAPDLLATCKDARSLFNAIMDQIYVGEFPIDDTRKMIESLDSIIAKTEGE